jgi:hypothetical protein
MQLQRFIVFLAVDQYPIRFYVAIPEAIPVSTEWVVAEGRREIFISASVVEVSKQIF